VAGFFIGASHDGGYEYPPYAGGRVGSRTHRYGSQISGRKKTGPQAGLSNQKKSDYLVAAAEAAASAAVEAAEAASEAAAEAVAAAAAASAAGVVAAASVVAGAAASVVVVVAVVSAAGASTAAGVAGASSFFEQAARATAIRETISRDFFMIFLLIKSEVLLVFTMNNYR